MTELSVRDKAILNCVFNPHLPLEEAYEAPLEKLEDKENGAMYKKSDTQLQKNKEMEINAVKLAENGKLKEALSLIDSAIKEFSDRPSLYNNRGHILQYLRQFEEAFDAVTKAIDLCKEEHKRTFCLAHIQRGVLNRKFKRDEAARKDFAVGAKFGDSFAKAQLVELNPYAALCNQMLSEVMMKQY